MAWLRILLAVVTLSAFVTLAPGCGDDDYNSDSGTTVTHDLSAAVGDLAAPPTTDGGTVDGQ